MTRIQQPRRRRGCSSSSRRQTVSPRYWNRGSEPNLANAVLIVVVVVEVAVVDGPVADASASGELHPTAASARPMVKIIIQRGHGVLPPLGSRHLPAMGMTVASKGRCGCWLVVFHGEHGRMIPVGIPAVDQMLARRFEG